jgi:hypothetical protein
MDEYTRMILGGKPESYEVAVLRYYLRAVKLRNLVIL